MWQKYFRDAYAALRCGNDRSIPRTDQFEEGLPSASMFDSSTRKLIVIDDLMAETDERFTTLFT